MANLYPCNIGGGGSSDFPDTMTLPISISLEPPTENIGTTGGLKNFNVDWVAYTPYKKVTLQIYSTSNSNTILTFAGKYIVYDTYPDTPVEFDLDLTPGESYTCSFLIASRTAGVTRTAAGVVILSK